MNHIDVHIGDKSAKMAGTTLQFKALRFSKYVSILHIYTVLLIILPPSC